MAPNQIARQANPWRDAHPFFLLSPLMGLLSRAWSRLRGPGPAEPWLVEAVAGADRVEGGLEREAKTALATHPAPWDRHPQEKTEGSGAAEDDGEAGWEACPDLKASNSLLEACGLSDDGGEACGEEEATCVARKQRSKLTDGRPALPSPSLLVGTLQYPPGEEESEEKEETTGDAGIAEDKEMAKAFFYPPSPGPRPWECYPGVEEEEPEDGEAAGTSTFLFSLGSKPRAWVYCPQEIKEEEKDEKDRDTEEVKTENRDGTKTSISHASSEPNPRAREYCSGEESKEEKDEKVNEAAEIGSIDSEPHSAMLVQRSLLRAWEYQPSENTEEEGEGEDEDSASGAAEEEGAAEASSSIPPTSAFLRAWVCHPGEDTEEEEDEGEHEDDASGAAEEEGEAEEGAAKASSSVPSKSAFLRTWVYQPGEDTEEEEDEDDEDSASGTAEEEEAAEAFSSIPPSSAFLRAWVYQPGEDTEEEEEEEDEGSDLEAAEEGGTTETSSSIPPKNPFLRAWVYHPGEDTEEEEEEEDDGSDSGAAEASSSGPPMSAFLRAWVYDPGEDTEDEEHEDKGDDYDSEAADSEPRPSLQAQTTSFGSWIYQPGEDTEEEGETEPRPFQVAIYLPGEKPPPPWAPPRLPLRLQRRLKSLETPTKDPEPETSLKARKVRFSEKVSVHILAVWAGPARATRRGPWEQFARDRSRFARRIARAQEELGACLTPAARARAWARLGSPPTSLSPLPAPTQTEPSVSAPSTVPSQATPLSPAVVALSPAPACVPAPPCLDLSGRRG
ncbi:protein phosphatase 1 regulatory subunit 15A [Choloepus didactylus]|uniref:protein phosphatase 1 regulatory subunit 15A n=1 Tax=Choloepus didactylus TaxID=27675 RepID=UPI00189D3B1F|nr:protein phosphatase 1 regulatory subunit 15A [Choloepus didactylus]